jgi:hypothetical protein
VDRDKKRHEEKDIILTLCTIFFGALLGCRARET